jgi:hypothetical protein
MFPLSSDGMVEPLMEYLLPVVNQRFRIIMLWAFSFLLLHPFFAESNLVIRPIPGWAIRQIENDFKPYKRRFISNKELNNYYEIFSIKLQLVKFTVSKNKIYYESNIQNEREDSYKSTLKKIVSIYNLPEMTFLISMHDGLSELDDVLPVFVMCKYKESNGILIPDFLALANRFQVLDGQNIAKVKIPWEQKNPILIWRGSPVYHGDNGQNESSTNYRVKLCQISNSYPGMVDAKFTNPAIDNEESFSFLQPFLGSFVSYHDQLYYKYHLLIDGNASSFSASGWKFFTNSVIFKPDSLWIQWYYQDLKPWIHYIPVKTDLGDLVQQIRWAQANDLRAKTIARNAREFALTHINESINLTYLYLALMKYYQLFIPHAAANLEFGPRESHGG